LILTAREGAQSSLTPIDPQPNIHAAKKPKDLASASPSQKKWTPTPQAFEKLLAALDANPEEAARIYEHVRLKLLRYFERNGVTDADRFADVTLDRVMRRIDEGEVIENVMAFIFKVASFVRMEAWKEEKQVRKAEEEIKKTTELVEHPDTGDNPRQFCLDRCLNTLPVETRILMLDYYSEDGSAKIRLRKKMAKRLGIEMNALRIRAHRIRVNLESCVKNCISQQG
jgi:DNA-directed RNA polymerase specialized sigma24 family protein